MSSGKRLLWVISYHHACNDGALLALVAILPILVQEMDLSYSEIGLLGFGLLITVIIQLVVGKAADRIFSRYLLELGAGLMALSFILIPLASNFLGLFVAVISMRVGASFYHPIGISWITKRYEGSYLDTALGIQSGVGNLGVILAFASSGFLGEIYGWRTPCIIWAVLNIIAMIAGIILMRNEEPLKTKSVSKIETSFKDTFTRIGIMAIPIAAGGALYQVTSYFGPLNLTELHGWSVGDADLVFAIWIGIGTVSSYYFGRLSNRFGRGRLLIYGYAVSSICVLMLPFLSSWITIAPVLVLFGAMLFITYPALFSLISKATRQEERGTAFGLLFGFQLGGGAVVVYLCGIVSDHFNDPSYSFFIVFILGLASIGALSTWMRGVDKS
ncbi:MAG: MFS transporter [Thermoplasmata archaeon]|nr:MFS transporter [Thermoplasmata archaeon]TFG69612.1 MAG: MFS transporter [Methanomassiliicoccus sp.]